MAGGNNLPSKKLLNKLLLLVAGKPQGSVDFIMT